MTRAAFTAFAALVSAVAVGACSAGTTGGAATPSPTYRVSGAIGGASAAGVTVTLTGAGSATTTSSAAGAYAFDGLANGSYAVTPSRSGFTFDPVSRVVVVNGADAAGQDFTATAAGTTYRVSGTVSGATAQGVTMTLGGTASGTTTSAADGTWAFAALGNGSYTVTPSKPGYTFSPSSRSLAVSGGNVTGEDFTAAVVPTWTISGTVSGATARGVTMTLGGTASGTTSTAVDGTYAFTSIQNGSYTVTPSKLGYAFAPSSRSFAVSGGNATGEDFVASVSTSTAPVIDPGFPICWTHPYAGSNYKHAFSFSTGGARKLVLTTSWYTDVTDPYPVTVAWTGGTPSGATGWTAQTWPGAPGAHDGTIHWTTYIFTASATDPISASTVTVTSHASDPVAGISCLWSVSGASGFGATADHHAPMADVSVNKFVPVQVTITATQANSLIIGHAAGGELNDDYGLSVPLAPLSNTTLVAQYVGFSDSGHVAFYLNAPTSAATTYTIGLRQTGAPTGGGPPGGYLNTQLCRAYAVEAIEVLAQ